MGFILEGLVKIVPGNLRGALQQKQLPERNKIVVDSRV
jgi:hypothetical protein